MSEVPSMITEKERITESALPDPKTELNGHSGSAERGKLKKTARIISCICHPLIIGSTVIILQATLAIHHPYPAALSLAFCLLMILSCLVTSLMLKVSLHSSISFYLYYVLLYYNPIIGLCILLLAVFACFSRRVLGLHTTRELIAGALIGTFWGINFLLDIYFYLI